ncbi:type I-C CRISPR-associated protein Cas8c/Csd1 [Aquabacter sp. L1I39]|uniref:type I-C CRISPR-associated protein Cas8c/Csd1 n=1 Tax=Aquabacter sp. L1I39 TaxID=2820278 RepID=UPI001ADC4132|nr:type I-C CRISPR-associated protein Cas8c/Csd1 [Aquabacter sp. L1I39]
MSGSSRNRLSRGMGDATLVFCADTSRTVNEEGAQAAESWFATFIEPPDDADEARKERLGLEQMPEGRPVEDLDPRLCAGTRFHMLGLAPNAARLSVRYWMTDDVGAFPARLAASNTASMRPLAREAVSFFPAQMGVRTASTSSMLTWSNALSRMAALVATVRALSLLNFMRIASGAELGVIAPSPRPRPFGDALRNGIQELQRF